MCDQNHPVHLHDVIIVGAGPCGLAVAARLHEDMPAASFTDDEHQRYHWIRKHSGRMGIKHYKNGGVTNASTSWCCNSSIGPQTPDMLVLDSSGSQWMTRWNTLFCTFNISHLRSPMFFHIDPGKRDGLLAYAHEQGREEELLEIKNCVGKEVSKHQRKKRERTGKKPKGEPMIDERERHDYFTPSTPLFSDHCNCIVHHYGLGRQGVIESGVVEDIRYDYMPVISQTDKVFSVRTDKTTYYAKIVVLAVGPGNTPSIPGRGPTERIEGACHAMQVKEYPAANVQAKINVQQPTNVLIVGGGLTSAQLADVALRRGVAKVWVIMRGPLKVKAFDIGLEWVGKFRNFEQAAFWSADSDEERLEKIRTARGGGSITPRYKKIVDAYCAKGNLTMYTYTTIDTMNWNSCTKTWDITLVSTGGNTTLPPIDHIYFATGIQTDYRTLPCLQSIIQEYPIPGYGGLPCINDDMMWKSDVPLFVTGRLAGLRLGPGAPNLVGARIGAERVAWSIQEWLERTSELKEGVMQVHDEFNYCTGRDNRYSALTSYEMA